MNNGFFFLHFYLWRSLLLVSCSCETFPICACSMDHWLVQFGWTSSSHGRNQLWMRKSHLIHCCNHSSGSIHTHLGNNHRDSCWPSHLSGTYQHLLINTFGVGLLRLFNHSSIILHSLGVGSLAIALVVKAKFYQSSQFVFFKFYDGTGGWSERASPAYVAACGILCAYSYANQYGDELSLHWTKNIDWQNPNDFSPHKKRIESRTVRISSTPWALLFKRIWNLIIPSIKLSI
jgi:hypothetical protein